MSVKFPLNEQSLFVSWAVVLRCPGQRQLDKVRCPEAAALVARPALLRHIGLSASSRKWPGLPRAPLLGELSAKQTERFYR